MKNRTEEGRTVLGEGVERTAGLANSYSAQCRNPSMRMFLDQKMVDSCLRRSWAPTISLIMEHGSGRGSKPPHDGNINASEEGHQLPSNQHLVIAFSGDGLPAHIRSNWIRWKVRRPVLSHGVFTNRIRNLETSFSCSFRFIWGVSIRKLHRMKVILEDLAGAVDGRLGEFEGHALDGPAPSQPRETKREAAGVRP